MTADDVIARATHRMRWWEHGHQLAIALLGLMGAVAILSPWMNAASVTGAIGLLLKVAMGAVVVLFVSIAVFRRRSLDTLLVQEMQHLEQVHEQLASVPDEIIADARHEIATRRGLTRRRWAVVWRFGPIAIWGFAVVVAVLAAFGLDPAIRHALMVIGGAGAVVGSVSLNSKEILDCLDRADDVLQLVQDRRS